MFKVPEMYRVNVPGVPPMNGMPRGAFMIPLGGLITDKGEPHLWCIASNGSGWEHVSISVKFVKKASGKAEISEAKRCPTWEEMCRTKGLFWDEEDVVVQFHPKKSEYVNMHPHTLHLWRPLNIDFPTPDPLLIGLRKKGGQNGN